MTAQRTPHALVPRLLTGAAASALVLGLALAGCAETGELSSLDTPVTETAGHVEAPADTGPDDSGPAPDATGTDPSSTPPTTAPSSTTAPPDTTAPPTTQADPPPPPTPSEPTTLKPGDDGPAVAELQQRLIDVGIYLPAADGDYGSLTQQAVLAFQKANGLGRDGVAGPVTLAAIETAGPIEAREGGDHIEIDLERQLMFVVRDGRTLVLNTSTGAAGMETPPGRFEVDREIDGMRHAPLGELWRPKYFNAGIALHGATNIPGHPASHGCARLHNAVIDMIWAEGLAPIGTPVWVY